MMLEYTMFFLLSGFEQAVNKMGKQFIVERESFNKEEENESVPEARLMFVLIFVCNQLFFAKFLSVIINE